MFINLFKYGHTIINNDGNTYQVGLQQQQQHFSVVQSAAMPSNGQQPQYSTVFQHPNSATQQQQHNSSQAIQRRSLSKQQQGQQLLQNYTNVRSPLLNTQHDSQYNSTYKEQQGQQAVFVSPSTTQQSQQQQLSQSSNNYSISRLSKQHPQLAAKLLQPSTLTTAQNQRNNIVQQQQQQIYEVKRDISIKNNSTNSTSEQIYQQHQTLPQQQHVQLISGNLPPTNTIIRTSYLPQKILSNNVGDGNVNGILSRNSTEYQQNNREFIQQQPQNYQQQLPLTTTFGAGIQSQQQQINLNAQQCHFLNIMPTPSVKLLERFNTEPSPIKYNLYNYDLENLNDEQKIHRDYLNNDEILQKRTHKNITLRQKRQKIRIPGSFRIIPPIDNVCKIMENYDFETSDLFPLGFFFFLDYYQLMLKNIKFKIMKK